MLIDPLPHFSDTVAYCADKVWRQASVIATVIAQFIAETNNQDVLDDGNLVALQKGLLSALKATVSSNVPNASLTTAGITKLSNATDSNAENVAATSKAVRQVTDTLNTKQDKGDYATNSALNQVNDNANSRLEKSKVVQKTGAASDHVMSQRAATEAFARGDLFTSASNISTILTPTKLGSLVVADGKHGPFLSLKDEKTGDLTFSVDSAGNIGQGLVLVQFGGTGAKTAEQARANLGLTFGFPGNNPIHYQLPGGLVLKAGWSTTYAAHADVVFPTMFENACIAGGPLSAEENTNDYVVAQGVTRSKTGLTLAFYRNVPGQVPHVNSRAITYSWFAIGY